MSVLKDLIRSKGLKSKDLAEKANVSKEFMSMVISGKKKPSPEVQKVFNEYGLNLNNLDVSNIVDLATQNIKQKTTDKNLKNIPANLKEAYLTDLKIAGNSQANIYEAGLVLGKVEKAGINLLNQDNSKLKTFIAQIPGKEVRDWKTGKPTGKFTYGNRAKYRKVLVAFYSWLNKNYHYFENNYNPAQAIPVPDIGKDVIQPTIMPNEVSKLLETESSKWKTIHALGLASSARRSELASINIEDVDLIHGSITVTGKNTKQRSLPIGWSKPYLQAYLDELKAKSKTKGSLFEITDEGIKTHFQRLSKQLGKPITAHAMRRGYAVINRKMGIPDTVIMQNAGWVNPKMLMTYSKALDITQANELYNKFSDDTTQMLGLPTLNT
jgi:integrase